MNIENLYNKLNSKENSSEKRHEIITFLKKIANNIPTAPAKRQDKAYEIAGLLSTDFARSLSAEDPIDNILTLAGELEVRDEQEAQKWEELLRLINSLA